MAGLNGSPRITGDGGSFSSLTPPRAEGTRCGSFNKQKYQLFQNKHHFAYPSGQKSVSYGDMALTFLT